MAPTTSSRRTWNAFASEGLAISVRWQHGSTRSAWKPLSALRAASPSGECTSACSRSSRSSPNPWTHGCRQDEACSRMEGEDLNDAVLAATSALAAAAVTSTASLGVVAYQERKRERAGKRAELSRAYVNLLARSMGIGLRARTMGEIMKVRSGLAEGIDVATRLRKPVDLQELYDWQAQDWDPMNEAWAAVWTRADAEGVRLANAVVAAAADLIGVSTARQPVDTTLERVRRWALGDRWTEEMLTEHQRSIELLARSRKELAEHARNVLGSQPADLFA